MLEYLSRYWWTVAIRGALAILFGLATLIWPDITLRVLVLLFGFYAVVDGLLALAALLIGGRRVSSRRGWLIVEGVSGITAGVVTFLWPDITALVLLYLVAAWAIVTGLLEIAAAIILRRELRGEWLLALAGVLSLAFGVLVALRPGEGAIAIVWVIGVFAILFGIALLVLGNRLRRSDIEALRRGAPPGPATRSWSWSTGWTGLCSEPCSTPASSTRCRPPPCTSPPTRTASTG